jgi:hypothetical protein
MIALQKDINNYSMKLIMIISVFILPAAAFSQITLKAGFGLGNRWNETLNSQTLSKGFRFSAEKNILSDLAIGAEVSYFSFNPNTLVNIRYNSYNLLVTYYFNAKKLQPFLGAAFGYTNYKDQTTLNLGGGVVSKQNRNKSYGDVSPFLGIKYHLDKKKKAAIFLQGNADFVPVANTSPIGFVSVSAGIVYRF